MSMTTYLQMVTEPELDALEATPADINHLDQPADQTFVTQLQQTLCYFYCGDGYPTAEDHGAIAAALMGFENIDAPTLETAYFSTVRPAQTVEIADVLDALDLDEIAAEVDDTDLESLVEEEELYDVEPMLYDDVDLTEMIVKETIGLRDFYRRAADEGLAVVIYTT